jgi:hypothetical protein
VIGGALFLLAVICPFVYIAPAYAKPPVIAAEDIPAEAHRLDVNFDDKIRLLACQLDKGAVKRGDRPGGHLSRDGVLPHQPLAGRRGDQGHLWDVRPA